MHIWAEDSKQKYESCLMFNQNYELIKLFPNKDISTIDQGRKDTGHSTILQQNAKNEVCDALNILVEDG